MHKIYFGDWGLGIDHCCPAGGAGENGPGSSAKGEET